MIKNCLGKTSCVQLTGLVTTAYTRWRLLDSWKAQTPDTTQQSGAGTSWLGSEYSSLFMLAALSAWCRD